MAIIKATREVMNKMEIMEVQERNYQKLEDLFTKKEVALELEEKFHEKLGSLSDAEDILLDKLDMYNSPMDGDVRDECNAQLDYVENRTKALLAGQKRLEEYFVRLNKQEQQIK